MFWTKSFWLIFVSVSGFHLVEDLFWAFLARFTSVSMIAIIAGILFWAMLTTLFIHSKPIKTHWHDNTHE